MDCHKIFYRNSWFPGDESYWLWRSSDFYFRSSSICTQLCAKKPLLTKAEDNIGWIFQSSGGRGGRWCFLEKAQVRGVCPASDVLCNDVHYTVKTVTHPDSLMVWCAFSGNLGRRPVFSPQECNHNWKQVNQNHNPQSRLWTSFTIFKCTVEYG